MRAWYDIHFKFVYYLLKNMLGIPQLRATEEMLHNTQIKDVVSNGYPRTRRFLQNWGRVYDQSYDTIFRDVLVVRPNFSARAFMF